MTQIRIGIQHFDTQHNNLHHNATHHNNTQHNTDQHNYTQHNDNQQNNKKCDTPPNIILRDVMLNVVAPMKGQVYKSKF